MRMLWSVLFVLGWIPIAGATGLSLALSAPQTVGGGALTLRITLAAAAPASGTTVLLASGLPGVTIVDPTSGAALASVELRTHVA